MGVSQASKSFPAASHEIAPGVALSPVQPDEAAGLGALFSAIDPWARYPVTAAQLAAFFAAIEPGNPRFAIKRDGALIGAIGLRTNWFRGPYIQSFALAPSAQGQGIGSAAMAWVEAQARAAQDRNLWVAASDFNTGAQRFYARNGFERIGAIDGLLQDGIAEILMRKRLYVAS